MNRSELLEKELNSFVKAARETYRPEKIILFGSLASGQAKENSDIDLVMVAETKDGFWERQKGLTKLCSRSVGMDVLFYTPAEFSRLLETRSFFKNEIQRKGKVIYDDKTA